MPHLPFSNCTEAVLEAFIPRKTRLLPDQPPGHPVLGGIVGYVKASHNRGNMNESWFKTTGLVSGYYTLNKQRTNHEYNMGCGKKPRKRSYPHLKSMEGDSTYPVELR